MKNVIGRYEEQLFFFLLLPYSKNDSLEDEDSASHKFDEIEESEEDRVSLQLKSYTADL